MYVYARTTHRVRKALFPDILIEDDLNNDDYALNPSSVVGQFAEPSQVLKAAILDLLMFKDQLDEVTGNIPHLIAGLCNPDQVKFCESGLLYFFFFIVGCGVGRGS